MGGGDLNLKKSWHPSTLKNQERVWKAEQQKAEEDRKMAELQRELKEERERELLQRTAEESGAVEKKGDAKLDWMYKGPGGHVSREEYLLGRKIDTAFDQMVKMENEEGREDTSSASEAPQSSKPAYTIEHEINPESVVRRDGNMQVDMKRKLMEDPLLLIRQNEEATRRQITDNPVKMKQLQQLISAIKTKKKKRHASSSSSSESSSSSSDSSDSEYEKRKKEKRKKRKDKKKKKKKSKKKKAASESESSDSSDEERKRKQKKKEKKAKKNSEKRKKSKKKEESESEQDTSNKHNSYSNREGNQTSMQKGYGRNTDKEYSPDRGARKFIKHRDTGRGDSYVEMRTERNRELDREREEMRRGSRDRRRERSNEYVSDRRGRSRDRSRERGRREDRFRKSRGHTKSRSRSRDRDQERSREGASNGHHRHGGKPKLTAKEMEKKRQEMMDAARKRDQDRKDNIQRYEEERRKEEKMEENAEKFLRSHVLSASTSSIQDRVKSRIGSLQKGGGHMDSNFLRK
ncbi:pre-mRNA-splicing factor CWC25 homolog [Penaeus chinensis]|uniref:pre-mRNA-splicing factor CWC25 homolog n=1 Tax=Penaeus chinensis TaxID=139456 RepID=UPI001FB62BA2|nr:pre-mRNA-splicing factor CWC25 homolog [Penaeus chinensis]